MHESYNKKPRQLSEQILNIILLKNDKGGCVDCRRSNSSHLKKKGEKD